MASVSEIAAVPRGYRIERLLGRGRTGSVYLAEQIEPKRQVALKFVAPSLAGAPGFRDRFLGDYEIVAGLDHPGVLPVYDSGDADGVLYVAMQCVDGADLETVLREGPLSAEQTAAIVEQVAGALHAAHCEGVVHRDVKPSNVLLEATTHRAYVADFGLGGPPGDCSPPERVDGKRLDGRADVYSLGCVVVKCLAGKLSPDLEQVVAKARATDPSERHTTAVELAQAVRRALPPPEPELPLVGEEVLSPRTRRLGWKPVALAAALVVVAVTAGLLATSQGGHRRAAPADWGIGTAVRETMSPVGRAVAHLPAVPAPTPPALPPVYDRVTDTGGVGVRYRFTPDHWCGGARPQSDPCWRDVVPGTGAAEGQQLRIYCFAPGVAVHGDSWWAKVRVKPAEFVPTTFLRSAARYSSIAPPLSRRC